MKYEVVVKVDESQTQVIESLASSIDQKLDKLSGHPSQSYAACIYRVSPKLREANEAAYTPRLVSIGPLHRDLPQLHGMEALKLKFLSNFLSRFGISPHTLVKFAAKQESFVRRCYEGTITLSPKKLTEVILLDGVFVVELFLENYFSQLRDTKELVFENQWMYNDLLHDMLLLENQLPISIMKSLLNFVDFSLLNEGVIKLTIYDLAQEFFKNVGNTQRIPWTAERCVEARHFVEFLLLLHAPERVQSRDEREKARKQVPSRVTKIEYTRSATELLEAGVKFRSGEGDNLFGVVFDLDKGLLIIPKVTINESTETFFKNLVAFEHLGYYGYHSKDITSYVVLMDGFINTSSDVDLLVRRGIIENNLGESQKVADLFNSLYKEVVTEANDFCFAEVCEKLNDYSRDRYHQLKASWFKSRVMLRRDYFSNPWSCISLFAATLLLLLTIIQTVCSILQVHLYI